MEHMGTLPSNITVRGWEWRNLHWSCLAPAVPTMSTSCRFQALHTFKKNWISWISRELDIMLSYISTYISLYISLYFYICTAISHCAQNMSSFAQLWYFSMPNLHPTYHEHCPPQWGSNLKFWISSWSGKNIYGNVREKQVYAKHTHTIYIYIYMYM